METRLLAHTDLRVSRVCFGTMTFGSQVDEPSALRIVDRCMELGVNFFDTANVYNLGASEQMLGKALKGRRDKVVVASKVAGKMGDESTQKGLSRAAMERQIEDSLRRLQTDYLDLYYLHHPDRAVPIDETLEAMDRLVRAGKVRYPASSNYSGWQVCHMQWIAEKNGYAAAKVTQPMYNLIARGIEQEYAEMARTFGISTVVYNPLAGGLLTGKQKREKPLAGTRFDGNAQYLNRYWHEQDFDAVESLRGIAGAAGRTLVSLALCWLLHHTATDCVILGASGMGHLEENVAACGDGPLGEDTVKACDEVWKRLRGVTPVYNR